MSFLVAGLWISVATFLAERLGSKLGGIISNLPSNIVVSLAFISINKGEAFASESARAVPLGMAIDIIFLFVFMAMLRRGIVAAILVSLSTWFTCAFLTAIAPRIGFVVGTTLFVIASLSCFFAAEFVLKIRSVPKRDTSFKATTLVIRAVFAGSVVSAAVASSNLVPPYLTGIVATFPAVLLSTMAILSVSQKADFTRATGKILLLSSSNIIVYAFVAQACFVAFGWAFGTLASFLSSIAWVAALRPLLLKIR
jgi:hypothetical protein